MQCTESDTDKEQDLLLNCAQIFEPIRCWNKLITLFFVFLITRVNESIDVELFNKIKQQINHNLMLIPIDFIY